jgi:hypothetical protein
MTRDELLDVCKETVIRHRVSRHGTPEDNFTRIAALWSAYLGVELQAHDVACLMVLLKVARTSNGPDNADNWIDMAGYAACGCEVATKGKGNETDQV